MNIFEIFGKGLKIYLSNNFSVLTRQLLFPVLGQPLGIIMIFTPLYFYINYVRANADSIDPLVSLGFIVLMIIPGFVVFLKAFWRLLIAMVSLNTMVGDILDKGKVIEPSQHNQKVATRKDDYVNLLLLLTLIFIVIFLAPQMFSSNESLHSVLILICFLGLPVILNYLTLVYVVFGFEKTSPSQTIKRSTSLICKNFWRTAFLNVLLIVITGAIAPMAIQAIFEAMSLTNLLLMPVNAFFSLIDIPVQTITVSGMNVNIAEVLAETSKVVVNLTISFIVSSFMLPLSCACYTLLYRDILSKRA